MTIQLNNNVIQVGILNKGAELCSLKFINDNTEYIWSANPLYWNRHSPVLFPIVGRVVNNQYQVDNTTYQLGQHGFARDMEFSVVDQSNSHVSMLLKYNEDSLKLYPYEFELMITYTLNNNSVSIEYSVKNVDSKDIYFSIGGHPGFNCPLNEDESFNDYYLEFEKAENASITAITKEGLLKRGKVSYLNHQNIIEMNEQVFKEGALIFDNLNSTRISLKSKKSKKCVHVDFEGFPFLGLWSTHEGAPFVCIEPWVGHADYEDFTEDFTKKEDQICLAPQDVFTRKFDITIE